MSPNPRRHDKDQENTLSIQLVRIIVKPNVTEDKDVDIKTLDNRVFFIAYGFFDL